MQATQTLSLDERGVVGGYLTSVSLTNDQMNAFDSVSSLVLRNSAMSIGSLWDKAAKAVLVSALSIGSSLWDKAAQAS